MIPKVEFDADVIKLTKILDNTNEMGYTKEGLKCKKIEDVYGKLMFQEALDHRPTTYASYVMSVDGKIAFKDDECGPLIAKKNLLDPDGAFADFWILNMLRANCDAIVIGSGTLIKEPEYSGSAYDPDLLDARIEEGKSEAPWTVITTNTGKRIPFQNPVFKSKEIPVLIITSPNGFNNLKLEIPTNYFVLPKVDSDENIESIKKLIKENEGKIAVSITGVKNNTDPNEMLRLLKAMDIETVLIESPTYCHHLMEEGLLDEIFINTSSIFVGGNATSIGSVNKAFTSTNHPHSDIVSVHSHKSNFLYTRYKMIYGLK